LIGKLPWLLLD